MQRKIVSIILAFVMAFGTLPVSVLASEGNGETYVAQVGSDKYDSLQTAVDAAEGKTVTLLTNVDMDKIRVTVNTNCTLDLNGYTLTSMDKGDSTNAMAIYVSAEKTFTLADGSEAKTGKVVSSCYGVYVKQGATFNMTGGTIELPGNAVYDLGVVTWNAAFNMTGGTIDARIGVFACDYYDAAASSIVIDGGTILVSGVDHEDDPSAAIVDDPNYPKGASINVKKGAFNELTSVVAYAATDAIITLADDVTIDELIKVETAITLDLGGKKVTSTTKKAFEVYANVTIKNGTIEAVNRCVDTRTAVELTLTDVTLIADEYTTAYGNPQPLTIGGSDDGTKITMTGVDISADDGYGIITFVKTELTATNSTIEGYNALYVKPGSEESEINFVNCDLTSDLTNNDVEGNSFSTIAIQTDNVTVNVDSNSSLTAKGDYACAVSLGYEGDPEVAGNVVTIAGAITGNILDAQCADDNTVILPSTYAEKLGAEGYDAAIVNDGLITVCATLAGAISAAEAGDTITLLDNVTVSEKIDVNKNVTVDLNGKTLTNAVVQNRLFNIKTGCSEFTLVGTTANSKIVHAPDMTYDTRNFGIIRVDAADVKVTVDGGTYACNTMTAVLFRTYASNTQFVFTNVVVETDGMILHTNSGSTVSSATITGGSYTSTGTSDKGNGFAISALTGPVNFKNVTISVAHGVAVEIGGTSAAVGNFENCTFTTTSDAYAAAPGAAIAVSGEAIANIISGTYTGSDNDGTYGKNAVMIYTSGGTVNVKGGTLNGDINVYDAGGYSDKAFAVEVTGTPTVNGGIEITDADASVNTIAVAVKGGTFSSDPTTYLASGYCVKHDTNYIVGTHGGTDDNDCTTAVLCGHCNAEITAAQASHTPNADDGDCTTAVTCSACGTVTTAAAAEHDWSDANGTCKTCGTTCGGSHSAGTTCSTCGKVTAPVYYPTYTPTVTPSAPSTSTETTENEDGSTTTTVTDNKTGTVTETTENVDGSTTTVETTKDGTVTETVENTDGSTQVTETKAKTTVKDDGTTETKTESTTTATDADGNVTTSTTTATETTTVTDEGATVTETVEQTKTESAEAVVETTTTATTTATEEKTETVAVTEETTTKADGTVETKTTTTTETELADGTTATAVTDESGKTEAEVVISEEAAASEEPVALPIPAVTSTTDSEAASTVTVTTNSETDTAVVIPVAEGAGAGTVAVIVNADGTETVITESVVTENGLEVSVPDGATIKVVDNSTDFVDVADNDWEKDAVDFTSARGIMQGTSTGENATFDSETPTTRAMVWTMLARLSGVDTTPAEGESWWSVGQKWAMENGISDGTMHDGEITREQLATMLYRFAGSPETDHDITHFDDHHETSDWALAAKEWAVANGVISGVGQADGSVTLEPKGNAIRSHVAQMFMNFMTKVSD